VLVFGSVHVGAQLVGGGPQRFFDVFDHRNYKTLFTITKKPRKHNVYGV
jgi:predicted component of type VI protein secretion system